ncbi:MAG: MCP four helix bundle domain-containing protein, partial [Desulfuromonadales bacterium]|nr:MCP four helix bundle domain-containing protein [Desulfuromonadales bacterium]
MFFKKMKIGARLRLGFTTILLILVSLVIFAIFEIWQLSSRTMILFEHPLAVSNAVLRINTNVIKIHHDMEEIVLSANPDITEQKLSAINPLENNIADDFGLIERQFLGPEEQVNKAREEIIAWKEIRNQVVALANRGEYEAASDITRGREDQHVERIELATGKLSTFANKYAATLIDNAKSARNDALFVLILLTILSIVLSIFIANRLTGSITRPLAFLKIATESIGLDSLGMRIGVFSNDEIGDLMVAFNRMADDLQGSAAGLTGEIERRKKTEAELLQNEHYLKLAQRVARLGHWRFYPETGDGEASDELYAIYNLRRGESGLEMFIDAIHPEDKGGAQRLFGRGVRYGEPWSVEYRLLMEDDSLRWVCVVGEPVKGADGKIEMILGTVQDITDRKIAGEAIIESERRFRRILESTPLGFIQYEMSPEGELSLALANGAAGEILKFDINASFGLSIEELFPGIIDTGIKESFQNVCLQQQPWHNESFHYEAESVPGVFDIHAFPTGPSSMANLFRDVTQEKRTQLELERREQWERLVAHLSAQFVGTSADTDQKIDDALAELGQFFQVDLCSLVVYSHDGDSLSVTHEWCAPKASSLAHLRQNIPVSLLPWVQDDARRETVLYVPEINALPMEATVEKQRWLKQGLKS